MQRQWFQPEVAGALRGHIRNLILKLFVSQASTVAESSLLPLNTSHSTTDAHGQRRGGMETQAAKSAALQRARAALHDFLLLLTSPDSIGHRVLLLLVTLLGSSLQHA